ncbi:putative disease resistance protein [Abeliophyllum distichum]|uniref:Disease resistance protein n=1 Tax=Abeliophyllum distichum TaxID=126358 RepID=A0ABD1RD40_9LAMI
MPSDMALNTSLVSLFIVDSVLDDLMYLINNNSERIVGLNDQIITVHEELMSLGSSITDIAVQLPQLIEKIQLIRMSIQEIKNKLDVAGVPEVPYQGKQVSLQSEEPPILEDIVVGFDNMEIKIAEQLVRGTQQLQNISISRMPGLEDRIGSRILFTTRNKEVRFEGSSIELPLLSEDECWELLRRKVFKDKKCPPKLLKIGKKIAANCDGLPLAVVVIAGVLANMKKTKHSWKKIATNLSSHISQTQDKRIQLLELSYKHLPMHLRPCFLYFGAFEEDKEIPVRKFISLWVSKGFVKKEEQKTLEDVALGYLMKLIDRNLVLVAKRRFDGGVKTCILPSMETFHRLECLVVNTLDEVEIPDILLNMPSLRHMHFLGGGLPLNLKQLTLAHTCMSPEQMEIIRKLECLEVLKLQNVDFEGNQWDTSEGGFPQLKYLKLQIVQIVEWNTSSDHLPRLRRLALHKCKHLKMIPPCIGDILTLQMIDVYGCAKAIEESAKQIQENQ